MIMVDHVEGQGDHTQSAIGQRRQGGGGAGAIIFNGQ